MYWTSCLVYVLAKVRRHNDDKRRDALASALNASSGPVDISKNAEEYMAEWERNAAGH